MRLSSETLRGAFPAIVTPFTADASAVDYDSFGELIDHQLRGGVRGIVVCGSTGETATLTDEEYRAVVTFARSRIGDRGFVIAGIGASSTARAVDLARFLQSLAVDGILLVTPPYNKPTQNGLVAHFSAVRSASDTPLIAYNVPGRTGVNLLPKTVGRLVAEDLIIGIKESSGSVDQALDIFSIVGGRTAVLSGEDSLVHPIMACGGTGTVSVVANLFPDKVSEMVRAGLDGRWEESRSIQMSLLPVARAMFVETNPIPIKAALAMKGLIRCPATRLPLTGAETTTIELLKSTLAL